ncbi:unnamed protein product, partial [Effrenium voratum]
MGAPFAVRLALVLSLASAQCPPQPPPCVATVGTCGERARPYSDWSSILRLTACGLPLQLRAGIAVSLSGSRASESASQEIVQTLSELAAVQGRGSIQISERDALSYCISFCILDDESSPRKAVEIYRSFVGDYNSSMDLLLGPSTFEFRGAAAQVAEEAIWPMILWSYPSDIGKSAIYNQQPPVAELLQTLASLRTEPRASVVPAPCSGLCEVRQGPQPAENCAQLQLPDTHRPRHLAQFLSCDGPCTDQDLDYCAVRKQVEGVGREKCRRHNATLRRPRCTQPSMVANVLAIVPTDARFKRATPPNHFHPQQRLWEGLESRMIVSLARPACLRASRALANTLQMHGGLAVSHATKRMVSNADQRGMD